MAESGETQAQVRNASMPIHDKWLLDGYRVRRRLRVGSVRYRERTSSIAMQRAIGVELFLLGEDPWRVFLTTDPPNGGRRQLIRASRLLMERDLSANASPALPKGGPGAQRPRG